MSKRNNPEHPELNHPSTKRAKQVDADTPYDKIQQLLQSQDQDRDVTKVVHWFRSKDMRIHDNRALHHASETAKGAGKPLICCYCNCPAEFEWHGTSPARVDFNFRNLATMREELKKLDIPLVFLEAPARDKIVPTMLDFVRQQGASHVFGNYEYEVDELRRDVRFIQAARENDRGFQVSLQHDQTVIEPGTMTTGGGKPMKIFTPYHKAWLEEVKKDPSLLDTVAPPSKNTSKQEIAELMDSTAVPTAPKEKEFDSKETADRIRKLWPAGHDAATKRLNNFLRNVIKDYAATRSNPAKDTTSRMSAYFSAGVVSMRETLSLVKRYNDGSADFSQSNVSAGIPGWVRELVFRELYRQTTMTTPHTAMNLPQNLKFDLVKWEEDEEGWQKWYEGKTGVPFVDAGMRQLNYEAWMHNRLRMNVKSYLCCNLLIDYRRGERYFAETLVDWDLSNNTQGWEPSYTVFNPVSQAEKNDPDGEYIRRWVPELKDVKGKAVFAPHARLSKEEFEKLGYPEPHVDWNKTKARAIERFKNDMHDAEP